jgi:hypothetical protein
MAKHKKPLFSNDFLDELAKEISLVYGGPIKKKKAEQEKPATKVSEKGFNNK